MIVIMNSVLLVYLFQENKSYGSKKPFVFILWCSTIVSGTVPGPDPTLMSATKLTGTENETTYSYCLAPGGPSDKENQVKMYKKKYRFRRITSLVQ